MGTATLIQQARIAIRQGRLVQARRLLRQAIHEDPHNHVAWLLLARATPDRKLAREYVNRAHLLQPDSPLVQRAFAESNTQSDIQPNRRLFSWRMAIAIAGLAVVLVLVTAGLGQGVLDQVLAQQIAGAEDMVAVPAPALPTWTAPAAQISPTGVAAIPVEAAATAETQKVTQPDSPLSGPAATLPSETGSSNEDQAGTAVSTLNQIAQPPEPGIPGAAPSGDEAEPASSEDETQAAETAVSADSAVAETAVEPPAGAEMAAPVETEPESASAGAGTVPENSVPGALQPGSSPGERWIDVNLTTQTLTAFEGDTPVLTSLISSGMWQFPTVTGQYRTWLKYESQDMSGYHLGYNYDLEDVPYVMYFYKDFAIHGAYWHNSFGTPMSHGCINMNTIDAGWLYQWAPIGTLVDVHH